MIGKRTLPVILIISSLCGCLTLRDLLVEPEIEFDGMTVRDLSLFEATPVFKFKVANPNPMEIPLRNVSYDLKINNKKFIKGVSEKELTLKAGGTGVLELPFHIQFMDLFESMSDFPKYDTVQYELKGNADVGGVFAIPYYKSGELAIPKLPEVVLKQVDIGKISFKGASLTFTLNIVNPNEFDLFLNELNYKVSLGEWKLASGITQTIPEIDKKGKTTLKIPLHINFLEFGRSLHSLLKQPTSKYSLSGDMKFEVPGIGMKAFPFQKSGVIDLK